MKGSRSVLAFDLAHGFCAHTGRKIGGGCAFSEPIGQPGQGALKVGARDVLHEVNGAAAPVLGDVVEPLPQLRPLGESDVEPVSLPAVRLRFVLLEAQGVQDVRQRQCPHPVGGSLLLHQCLLGALTLPALLIGRRLGRLLGGAITSAVRARAKDGRLVGRWPRPAHRPICRGSAATRGGTSISRSHGRGDLGVVATHPLVRGCAALDPAR